MPRCYQLALLYLIHLLVGADGDVHEKEANAIAKLKQNEKIDSDILHEFEVAIGTLKEREIYQRGMDLVNECSHEDKLKTFVALYKMSEEDGHVHVKEIRLLLYSIQMAGIEFDDVVHAAKHFKGFA